MQEMRRKSRRADVLQSECAACGCCAKVCPSNAITITKGVFADVDIEKCVGCGKCSRECPASVIAILEVPA